MRRWPACNGTRRDRGSASSATCRGPKSVNAFVDAVAAAAGAPIDILVNNAGATWGAPAEEHPLEGWNKVIDLNLTGVFLLTQQIGVRWMIPRTPGPHRQHRLGRGLARARAPRTLRAIAYHTSKGGLVNFTRALAGEWGQFGITVNAICPGFIPSKMTQRLLDKIAPRVIEATPLHQLGEPRGSRRPRGAARRARQRATSPGRSSPSTAAHR